MKRVLVAVLEVQKRNGVQIDESIRNMFRRKEEMSMERGRRRKKLIEITKNVLKESEGGDKKELQMTGVILRMIN